MKTENKNGVYTIEESWIHIIKDEYRYIYSGQAIEKTHYIDIKSVFYNYDEAIKEFKKYKARIEYNGYQYNLYEYQLIFESLDDLEISVLESKEVAFVAYDENGKEVAKSDRMKDLIEYDIYDNVKVVSQTK